MSVNSDALIGLFFEVTPHLGHSEHYFSYVEKLKPELAKHSGLIWIDRYRASSANNFRLLSYQLWDGEKSIEKWRKNKTHRYAQKAGVRTHFKDYRIRVGERLACWSAGSAIKLNMRSPAKSGLLLMSIQSDAEVPQAAFAKYGSFDSTYCGLAASNKSVTLVSPNDLFCAEALALSITSKLVCKVDLFLIDRDYSMAQRDQVFPTKLSM
jgi:heme-degrading monooxygenase HmoA